MQMVHQFCLQVVSLLGLAVLGMIISRGLSKPRGTYGDDLPERRRRPRMVLPDPATLRPRRIAPGDTI
jgi:hypothetical protein